MLKEIGVELSKSPSIVVTILGTLVLAVSLTNGIPVGNGASLQISDPTSKVIFTIIGIALILSGLYTLLRDSNQSARTKGDSQSAKPTSDLEALNEPSYLLRSARNEKRPPFADLTFVNSTNHKIKTIWIDSDGHEKPYTELLPNQSHTEHSHSTHVWLVRDMTTKENILFVMPRNKDKREFVIQVKDLSK